MSIISKMLLGAGVACLLSAARAAEREPCASCEAKEPTAREQIKVAREKYDRENVPTTARPWDGLNLGRAEPDKKVPTAVR